MIPGGIYNHLLAVSKKEGGGFLIPKAAGDRTLLRELAAVVHTKKNSVEI